MEKNSKFSSTFLLLGTTLILGSTTSSVSASVYDRGDGTQAAQGQDNAQIEALGYLGTAYEMTAHNIVVHVKDVPKLNIWRASEASVSVSLPTEVGTDKVTPAIHAPTLQEKSGVYPAELSFKEDPTVHTTIKIFVLDDSSATDGRTVLFGHDFQLTKAEKMKLTPEKVAGVAGIHAYDVASGQYISSEVQEKSGDLQKYLQEDLKLVDQHFFVRGVNLTIQASTLLSPGQAYEHSSGERLPDTGERESSLSAIGMFVFNLLGLFVVNKRSWKKIKES